MKLIFLWLILGTFWAAVDASDGFTPLAARLMNRGIGSVQWVETQNTKVAPDSPKNVGLIDLNPAVPSQFNNQPENPILSHHIARIEKHIEDKLVPTMQKGWEKISTTLKNSMESTQSFWHTVPGYLQTIGPAVNMFVNVASLLVLLSILFTIRRYTRTVRRIARRETGHSSFVV